MQKRVGIIFGSGFALFGNINGVDDGSFIARKPGRHQLVIRAIITAANDHHISQS